MASGSHAGRRKFETSTIKERAEEYFPEMVEIRRDIHRHPEIGRNEVRTSALIRKKLEEYGVDAIERPVPTAVVALIHGARGPGRCVALRCDIDALPVQEETGLPYTSENPGIMHACGHDMHASMMLGAAKILCGMRERFAGCVKLIFQHSEDTLPGGAKELVEKGVLENPHVDAIYGMHVLPDAHRAGQVGFHIGPITTSVDLFDFTVSGRGGTWLSAAEYNGPRAGCRPDDRDDAADRRPPGGPYGDGSILPGEHPWRRRAQCDPGGGQVWRRDQSVFGKCAKRD